MTFKEIAQLKETLRDIPDQSTLVSSKLVVSLKDGDIISVPSDNSEYPKKGIFALVEYLMRFTGVDRKQANEIASSLFTNFKNMKYLYTMTDLNGRVIQFETLNGVRYTKIEKGYRIYEITNKLESEIDHGHYYAYFKDGETMYESYYTNDLGFKTLTTNEPKEKQLSIFDFE